ncbi:MULTISPECIES: rRNA maturation RNase YbeY [unclassified Polynucleobacter]|uniref:rRNA maturation RNase YbeY n=1 Tax=unclassified Polynucleobacter TaxID=2640945 RepID=UPI00257309EB|nr:MULTISPECIES: rRNA maturation RNase YbeY [unclassified Polynucleobacter]BEI43417.1 rRNA maturation RNase YbeY [Polynucleobacter sp. HIN10]BEI45194.1 rRNA maturation RNase YbeY [Polynucleobacter sp. HIN11]
MSQTLNLDLQFATQALQNQVLRITSLAQIRKWAGACFQYKAMITLRFVNQAEAHDLNLFFRGFDKPTNVLTFSYPTQGKSIEADIVLCLPILRKEAKEQQKPLVAHLAHLLIHGCLHAKGYDHLKPKDAKQMEALEIKILQSLGFANPY